MKTLLALAPFITIGDSILLSWLVSLILIAAIVWFITWCVRSVAGPPEELPRGVKIGIWVIAAIIILVFVCAALGLRIP